jgi:hypothetical protein
MNFRYIVNTFTRIFLVKKSLDNQDLQTIQNLQKIINNITIYTHNYSSLSCNERVMLHSMINLIN